MREMENKDETLAKMREERWALYIARAVERFDAWWLHVLVQMEQSTRLEGKQMISTIWTSDTLRRGGAFASGHGRC
jgi:hypothetical protein